MHLRVAFIANLEPSKGMEPGEGTLHDPPMSSQSFLGLDAATSNARGDAALAQGITAPSIVIAFIEMGFVRTSARATDFAFDRGDGIDHRFHHARVVRVRP